VLLFTLEESPQDLPARIAKVVFLQYFFMPAYPDKKVALPSFSNLYTIYSALAAFKPAVIHITSDGIAQLFALAGLMLDIPTVGSFHTDIVDLVKSHNANFFQIGCIVFKEFVDAMVLNTCATTSRSFAVSGCMCAYVCMYVYIYVCMYVCMYI
jgi:hypothetical protein